MKKPGTIDKTSIVKSMSRAHIGTVPVTKVVPQKTRRDEIKHKKRALEQAAES